MSQTHLLHPKYLRIGVFTFFATYLILGLAILPDYGVSWDEEFQRRHGRVAWDYVHNLVGTDGEKLEPAFNYEEYEFRFHGVLFSMVAHKLEKVFGLTSYKSIHYFRHYLVFVLFWLASFLFFKILLQRFQKIGIALLGVLFLVFSPRIFAESFYNVKDLVFLSTMVFGGYTFSSFLKNSTFKNALLHGLICAVAINVRLLGIILPLLTFILFIYAGKTSKNNLLRLLLYLISAFIFTIAFWPYLWAEPIGRFLEVFAVMGKYFWDGDMLYWGKFILSTEAPWHYIPSWIGVTTPILYLLFFLIGATWLLLDFSRLIVYKAKGYRNFPQKIDIQPIDLFFFLLFFSAVLGVIVKKAVLYDGWRHMYFVYPSLIFLAVWGFNRLFQMAKPKWGNYLLAGITGISLLGTVIFTIKNHPHQNVYFNSLAGKNLIQKFEMDYWGLSYKQALEKFIELHPSDTVTVAFANFPGEANWKCLAKEQQDRIMVKEQHEKVDYFFTNYRFPAQLNAFLKKEPPYEVEVFVIKVRGNEVVGVYRGSK